MQRTDATLPPRFTGNINFNAQHSPMGAFMSFTCGHVGSGGGIGVEIGRPAGQDVYVGVKSGDRRSNGLLMCLPFTKGATTGGAADYQVEQAPVATGDATQRLEVKTVPLDHVARHYGWATDAWVTRDFTFSVYTPFGSIPDPAAATNAELRDALLPAVVATLRVDNRQGRETKTGVFAMNLGAGARTLAGTAATGAVGFALRRNMGVLARVERQAGDTQAGGEPFVVQRWGVAEALGDVNPVHMLGSTPGVAFEVPAGQVRTLVIAIGVYLEGVVTTGLEGRYFYARYYASLQDVLAAGLERSADLRQRAAAQDAELTGSKLSADQQFLIAHATRSYYGSTQLLDVGGEPFWVVNEGEYCMMNTLDLSVDHVFWELDRNPWVVRNLLDNFVRHYSFVDEVHDRSGRTKPGGMSFTHDMGVHNNFSPRGHSSYELPHLNALCFSHMTAEQLCNWTLMAACYVAKTKDVDWMAQNGAVFSALYVSLRNRTGEHGFVHLDSSRCGKAGAEITTYDSLDHSLAQTRSNLYMATKCWATWMAITGLLNRVGRGVEADDAQQHADWCAQSIARQMTTTGFIPAVFEPDNIGYGSRILPAVEALIYTDYIARAYKGGAPRVPDDIGNASPELDEMYKALVQHTSTLLMDPEKRNLFPDGGIRLSSTSDNSWASKIAIFQHVARRVLKLDEDPQIAELMRRADAAHVKWQTDGSGYWACSDQFVNGEAKGSKYYPRIITTALWLS